jgi:tetratricopeptide (TPR) repeat protein
VLAELLEALRPGAVVTLCGPGGIGKSALAAEAVWALAPGDEAPARFPDGVFFHSFYGQPQTDVALESMARAFGEEPRPTPGAAARRGLAGKRALLMLDGAEDADDLRAVLEVRGGCGVLVTTRKRGDALAVRLDVGPLPKSEAVELLRKWAGEVTIETRTAGRMCRLVGFLPMAVRLAGRYLVETGETATEYIAWLEETPLEALDQGERRQESVDVLLGKSLAQVSAGACDVWGVVGVLALAPFERAVLAAALELEPGELRGPVGELVSYGLLVREGARYAVSHALVHTYARERVAPAAEAVARLAGYYDALAEAESAKGPEGYRRLDGERGHVMRVLRAGAERERWAAVRSLVWAVEDYLDICGYWTEGREALEWGVRAAQADRARYDEGAFLGNLGNAYYQLGQVERAIDFYAQALEIAREIGDRQGESRHCYNLACAYALQEQSGEACRWLEKAIALDEKYCAMAREDEDFEAIRGAGCFRGLVGMDH